jgi:hypothetical protein
VKASSHHEQSRCPALLALLAYDGLCGRFDGRQDGCLRFPARTVLVRGADRRGVRTPRREIAEFDLYEEVKQLSCREQIPVA